MTRTTATALAKAVFLLNREAASFVVAITSHGKHEPKEKLSEYFLKPLGNR